jgi:hypothetical protein
MFLNIITPCSRPENLIDISKSINIPRENYRWIVVCDSEELPDKKFIPDNCEIYTHKNPLSIVGNSQRNYAIDLVEKGHIYFNDDDTIIHPFLWKNIFDLGEYDLISFMQLFIDGKLRLLGNTVGYEKTDSHNFIVDYKLVGNKRWVMDRYQADGIFAGECFKECKKFFYIPLGLSVYNLLRFKK